MTPWMGRVWVLCLTGLLAGCGGDVGGIGGGGGGAGGGGGLSGPDPVADTLAKLNIDTSDSPRVTSNNEPVPESFTPLGKKATLSKKNELFLAGLVPTQRAAGEVVSLLKFLPGVSNVPGVPNTPDATAALPPQALDGSWKATAFNAAAAGDVDGDGLEEVVVVWQDAATSAIRIRVIDDQEDGFVESPASTLLTAEPTQMRVLTGDFDGDARDDIVIAIADDAAGQVELHFLTRTGDGGYTVAGEWGQTYAASAGGATMGVEFAAGQLDQDGGEELVVVINETFGGGRNGSPGSGTSFYYIYDDQGANQQELAGQRITAFIDSTSHDGVTGTVAVGDIDGDGMDEIVLAALADGFPVDCDSIATLHLAMDDLVHELADLGSAYRTDQRRNGCETSGNNGWTSHLWAGALDIDGDQVDEIHVNGVVYEDFLNGATPWEIKIVGSGEDAQEARIEFNYLFSTSNNNGRLRTTRDNTVMAVGDVTADGMDDIVVYMPGRVRVDRDSNGNSTFAVNDYAVTVWGIDPLTGLWGKPGVADYDDPIGLLYLERLQSGHDATPGAAGAPQIVPVNVDEDSTVLKFSEGSHQLVFSEPIVHAALAAPPCHGDGSQITDVCQTSWGQGNSVGATASVSHEISVKHHTGVTGGVSLPVIGEVGVEVESTVGVSLKAEASLGYELTRTITYTTGSMEDTVIATVVPYDQYTYTILCHPVYPELVGKDMVISLPRTPRTMQISREFYNSSVEPDAVRIDDRVFDHTIGVVDSYPTRSDMLSAGGIFGAKSVGPVDVGASRGSTTVDISESVVGGFTATVAVSYETTVKATAGKAMEGYTVGSTTEASLGFSVGSSVNFTGVVGDMPSETFTLDKAYSYGMFVYQQDPGGDQRPFQVVNYWVE